MRTDPPKLQPLALFPAFLFFAFFAAMLPVNAAPLPVSLRPLRIEIEAPPGAHLTETVYFWNGNDAFLPVHIEGADFSPQGEEGHVAVDGEEVPANSLQAWVRPVYPDVNVAPKEEIALDFAIDVPPTADPGEHWGTLVVTTAPVGQSGGVGIQARLATVLLVRVLGDVREKLTLENFSAPRFLQTPPLHLEARFKNDGTVHEAPQGTIEVRNMFGMLASTSTLPVRNVLPGAVRKITASVGEGFWLGRYTATLRASYGNGKETLISTATFWVVPWRTQGWKVFVATVFIAFVIWKRRNFGAFWYTLKTGLPPPQENTNH